MKPLTWFALILGAAAIAWLLFDGSAGDPTPPERADSGAPREDASATLVGRAAPTSPRPQGPRSEWKIPGLVVDAQGKPVAGVAVVVRRRSARRKHGGNAGRLLDRAWRRRREDRPPIETVTSGPHGRFEVTPRADASSWYSVEARPAPPGVGSTWTLTDYRVESTRIFLVVTQGSALRGRVVGSGGKGVAATLDLSMWSGAAWANSGSHFDAPGFATDADGRFQIPAVPPGMLSIMVHVRGRILRTFKVATPTTEEIVLRLYDEEGARISGTVLDRTTQPIAGAQIALSMTAEADKTQVVAMATTDEAGAYACGGLPAGSLHEVAFEAPGFRIARFEGGARPLAPEGALTIDMTLHRGVTLEGQVRTRDGAPVVDATVNVQVHLHSSLDLWTAGTDEEGAYRIEGLPPERHGGVRVDATGLYQPAQREGVVEEPPRPGMLHTRLPADEGTTRLDVVLLRAVGLLGRTVDLEGEPVSASVRLTPDTKLGQGLASYVLYPPLRPTATSGPDGAFRFEGLPPGTRWRPQAVLGTLRSAPHEPVDVPAAGSAGPIELVVGSAASVEGVVVDPDGTPAAGLRVHVADTDHRTQTGPGGRFALTGLAPGPLRLRVGVSRTMLVADPIDLSLAEGERKTEVRITTRSPLVTTGRIVSPDGNPLARRTIYCLPAALRGPYGGTPLHTDGDGRFEARHWEPGEFKIFAEGSQAGDVFDAGDADLVLQLRPAERKQVTIRILGPDGAPVPQCDMVVMTGSEGLLSGSTKTVHQGVYVLDTRQLDTRTEIQVSRALDASGERMNVRPAHLVNVDMTGEEIVIRLEAARVLRGIVVNPDGGPVEGVRVSAGWSGSWSGAGGAVSDPEGRFTLEGLPAHAVTLKVRTPSPWLPPAPIDVAEGQEDVRIALTEGQRLRIEVVGPDRKPVAGAEVLVRPSDYRLGWHRKGKTDLDGVFETGGMTTDAVLIIRVDPVEGGIELPATERRDVPIGDGNVRIELAAPVWIEGVVVDAEGKPLGGVSVSVDGMIEPRRFGVGRRARTEKETGRFRVGPLAAGTYWVSVSGSDGMADSGQMKVKAPEASARFVLTRATSVEGRLMVEDIKGWSLEWMAGRDSFVPPLQLDGRFRLQDVPDLVGTLWAHGPGGRYALLENVRPGAGPFRLQPQVGGRIRGHVEGGRGSGEPVYVGARRGGLYAGGAVAKDGTFVVEGLPPGPWRVELWRGGVEQAALEGIEPDGEPVVLRASPAQQDR